MNKEWKCADCCVFGTDACHYPSMESHYIACEHFVVDHDKAYQMGRADLLKSIRECAEHLGYDDIEDLLSYVNEKEQKNEKCDMI